MDVSSVDGDIFAQCPDPVVDEELEGYWAVVCFGEPVPFGVVFAKHRHALLPAQTSAFAADIEHSAPSDVYVRDDASKFNRRLLGLSYRRFRRLLCRRLFCHGFARRCFRCLFNFSHTLSVVKLCMNSVTAKCWRYKNPLSKFFLGFLSLFIG